MYIRVWNNENAGTFSFESSMVTDAAISSDVLLFSFLPSESSESSRSNPRSGTSGWTTAASHGVRHDKSWPLQPTPRQVLQFIVPVDEDHVERYRLRQRGLAGWAGALPALALAHRTR